MKLIITLTSLFRPFMPTVQSRKCQSVDIFSVQPPFRQSPVFAAIQCVSSGEFITAMRLGFVPPMCRYKPPLRGAAANNRTEHICRIILLRYMNSRDYPCPHGVASWPKPRKVTPVQTLVLLSWIIHLLHHVEVYFGPLLIRSIELLPRLHPRHFEAPVDQ